MIYTFSRLLVCGVLKFEAQQRLDFDKDRSRHNIHRSSKVHVGRHLFVLF